MEYNDIKIFIIIKILYICSKICYGFIRGSKQIILLNKNIASFLLF